MINIIDKLKANSESVSNFTVIPTELEKTTSKLNIAEVFSERKGSYLNEFTLFLAYFNSIPNFIHEINIDCKAANLWFLDEFKTEIKDISYNKRYFGNFKKAEYDDIFYILYDDLIVDFDTNNSIVRFLFRTTDYSKVDPIIEKIKNFKKKNRRSGSEISLLVVGRNGISTKSLKITKPKLSIEDNYNEDFKAIHQTIYKRLSKKNDKGLVLLHGKPGTGKTSYIRYLVSLIKKDVIFLPPNMAGAITNPDLISILIENPNSIFVIEDAENIVVDRENDGNSPVSTLLNISDGLLSDCLNIQVICSFNVDISKVDSALLRKGRLIAKYEFGELEVDKANRLSERLGFKDRYESPKTLASIYNQQGRDFQEVKKTSLIGFKTLNN